MEKEAIVEKPTEEVEQVEHVDDDDLVTDSNEHTEEREQEKSKPFSKLMKMLSFNKRD